MPGFDLSVKINILICLTESTLGARNETNECMDDEDEHNIITNESIRKVDIREFDGNVIKKNMPLKSFMDSARHTSNDVGFSMISNSNNYSSMCNFSNTLMIK